MTDPSGGGASARTARPATSVRLAEFGRRFLLRPEPTALAAVIGLIIVFTALKPELFPDPRTAVSVMNVAAELGILSIGVTLLMIGGHFDLSVGAILGLTSWVIVELMNAYGLSPFVALPIAVAVGAGLGFINGSIVTRFRIHSFVVTLGTMLIYRGILIALTGGFPAMVEVVPLFRDVMAGPILPFGLRMSMVWFLIIGVIGTVLLLRTRFGNWTQGRGQNEQAARNLGVPTDRVTITLFMIAGSCAAIAGAIQVGRFASVDALRGQGMELQAVAVTVIGGTLLSGGYGSVIGTMLGAITFGIIQTGLVLAGVPGHFFNTLTGMIVIGAVILNTGVTRRIATSRPVGGFHRSTEAADAAIRAQLGVLDEDEDEAQGTVAMAGADPPSRERDAEDEQ